MQGAAAATFMSYLICFWIRMFDARRFVPFKFSVPKNIINTALMLMICVLSICEPRLYMLWCIVITALITLLNYKPIWAMAKRLIRK